MKVRIMKEVPLTDFNSDPPGRAVVREAGEEVDFPDWYASGIIKAGLATSVGEPVSPPPEPPKSVEFKASESKPPRGRPKRT